MMIDALSGLTYGALLFLIASGLTMTIGLMKRVNLTHGAIFLVGGYVALDATQRSGSYLIGLVAGVAVAAIVGLLVERWLLQWVADNDVAQILLTVGVGLLIQDQIRNHYSANPQTPPAPEGLGGVIQIGSGSFPILKLATLVLALLVAIGMTLIIRYTRIGARLRASVDDTEMARSVGVHVSRLYMFVFAIGSGLAGFAGIWGGSYLSLEPELGWEILLLGLVVIVVGGMDSVWGAFLAALGIGLLSQFGRIYFPELANFMVYGLAVLVLIFRPRGLLGKVVTRDA